MKKEKVAITESVAFAQANLGIAHHVERLHADAKKGRQAQKFVLESGMTDEGTGERILTVQPDGSHTVEFVKEKK
jgi:hypothetical protein